MVAYNKIMKRSIIAIFFLFCISTFILFMFFNFVMFPRKFENLILKNANEFQVDSSLVFAIVKAESGFDEKAVSSSGALGLMQILPSTAEWIAQAMGECFEKENLFLPEVNLKYGCFYLRYLFLKFNDIDTVVVAYNAGESKVKDWFYENESLVDEQKIDYTETSRYLKKVKRFYKMYKNYVICA